MLIVFTDPFFGGFEIHGPATFPVMGFTWEAVQNVFGITVFQALNLVTLKFDGFEDLRSGASVIDFAGLYW